MSDMTSLKVRMSVEYPLACELAFDRALPLDSNKWYLRNEDGYTVAHMAARCDDLPHGAFIEKHPKLFINRDNYGITVAHFYVIYNYLSLDFPFWDIEDYDGDTIAHWAAIYGTLPQGFKDRYPKLWNKKNTEGFSVEDYYKTFSHIPDYYYYQNAEKLAFKGRLSIHSEYWGVCNREGNTLAYMAAQYNKLPKEFIGDCTDITRMNIFMHPNKNGYTPAHWYALKNVLPLEFPHWNVSGKDGSTVARWASEENNLPDGFIDKYQDTLCIQPENDGGETIAHHYARHNGVNLDTKYLDLKDNEGFTVLHYGAISGVEIPYELIERNIDLFIQESEDGSTPAHAYVRRNILPAKFPFWGLETKGEYILAHEAVKLPDGFKDIHPDIYYNAQDFNGNTLEVTEVESKIIDLFNEAMKLAKAGKLPNSSDLWLLLRFDDSLAEIYVRTHVLPLEFIFWDHKNIYVDSNIAYEAAMYNTLPEGFIDKHMKLFISPNEFGFTPAHRYVEKNILPLDFPHWGLTSRKGYTVAHHAVKSNTLPDGFAKEHPDIWATKDPKGRTLEEYYNIMNPRNWYINLAPEAAVS